MKIQRQIVRLEIIELWLKLSTNLLPLQEFNREVDLRKKYVNSSTLERKSRMFVKRNISERKYT
jgi:hypothetical protein